MYDYIKGKLTRKTENYAVLENNGIGYKIITTKSSLANVKDGEVTFYTYLYVREDIFDLYGFSTIEERSAFELLISVSGVGPKAAVAILSCVTASELAIAIVTNQPKTITAAQGVGNKMAQKIILELKDKIKNQDIKPSGYSAAPVQEEDDTVNALVALGYNQAEIITALRDVPAEYSVEEKIKYGLKNLMKF
ncbi:MAG: Holliday junction branch migration protein RuvA [Clostridia bacterium]|nr:Holliday junction branch migration protein RuvA [Clostridia bacterium]